MHGELKGAGRKGGPRGCARLRGHFEGHRGQGGWGAVQKVLQPEQEEHVPLVLVTLQFRQHGTVLLAATQTCFDAIANSFKDLTVATQNWRDPGRIKQ